MKKKVWQIRIPTGAALVLLLISIWFTSSLIQSGVITVGQAALDKTPANVIISNITPTSFVVAFTTNGTSASAISVEAPAHPTATFFDQRSKNGGTESFYSHRIIATNLTPNTLYRFTILSDGEKYLLNGLPYEVKTSGKINGKSKITSSVSGKVILPDSLGASDTLVEVTVPGAQKFTSLTDSQGKYSIPLKGLLTSDLKNYANPKSTSIIVLRFLRQDLTSQIRSTIKNSSKVPLTALTYQYDFTTVQTQPEGGTSALSVPANQTPSAGAVSITVPSPSQYFVDVQPQFSGTGVAAKKVTLIIEPGAIKGTTLVGKNGIWTFRPDVNLTAGKYSLRVTSTDSLGLVKSVSQEFGIFGTGSQIAGSGPTPTPTPRPTATPTPVKPTATPTKTPTATPTPVRSTSLSPTIALSPTTTPTTAPSAAPTTTVQPPTATPTTITLISPSPTLLALAPSATSIPTFSPTSQSQKTPGPQITPVPTGSLSTFVLGIVSVLFIAGGVVLLFII